VTLRAKGQKGRAKKRQKAKGINLPPATMLLVFCGALFLIAPIVFAAQPETDRKTGIIAVLFLVGSMMALGGIAYFKQPQKRPDSQQ